MMNPLADLRGIVTVLNTPFTEDDGIDIPGLRAHVRYAIDAGVVGFLVPALASEVHKLTESERILMVETVVEEADGRVPVIGGASAESTSDRKRIARGLIERGCAGVLVQIPYENDEDYTAAVQDLAGIGPPLLMLQDWAPDGIGLPVPLIARLFESVPCFRCLKIEVAPAGVKYSRVIEVTGGQLHVSGGWAVGQLIEGLDRGVHAFMPTALHRTYVAIYQRHRAGDRAGAEALFRDLLPILAFSNQHLDLSVHFFKRLLHAQGYYATSRVRDPILPFDAHHERIAADLIRCAIALEQTP